MYNTKLNSEGQFQEHFNPIEYIQCAYIYNVSLYIYIYYLSTTVMHLVTPMAKLGNTV